MAETKLLEVSKKIIEPKKHPELNEIFELTLDGTTEEQNLDAVGKRCGENVWCFQKGVCRSWKNITDCRTKRFKIVRVVEYNCSCDSTELVERLLKHGHIPGGQWILAYFDTFRKITEETTFEDGLIQKVYKGRPFIKVGVPDFSWKTRAWVCPVVWLDGCLALSGYDTYYFDDLWCWLIEVSDDVDEEERFYELLRSTYTLLDEPY